MSWFNPGRSGFGGHAKVHGKKIILPEHGQAPVMNHCIHNSLPTSEDRAHKRTCVGDCLWRKSAAQREKNNQSNQNGLRHFQASKISYAYSLAGARSWAGRTEQSCWEVGWLCWYTGLPPYAPTNEVRPSLTLFFFPEWSSCLLIRPLHVCVC